MSSRGDKPRGPVVEVVRRPVTPRTSVAPSPSPSTDAAPAPAPVAPSSAPPGPVVSRPAGRPPPRGGGRRFSGPSTPRPPPTAEQIAELARRERVPNRIAKGELIGKMKCRIWKKLHAEEAKRFDAAWTLVEKTPGLSLADAFGVVQSGMTVDAFALRRAKARGKEEVKTARASVAREAIDAFIAGQIAARSELSIVLGERALLDVVLGVQPVAFDCERSGRLEKLNVVLLTRKATWEALLPTVLRDPKLTQKPTAVSRQPSRRPVNDPRPLLPHVGAPVTLVLRNGMTLTSPLLAVGPFDVLVGSPGAEVFVPLHAMLSWSVSAPAV